MNSAVAMPSKNTAACSGCPDHQARVAVVRSSRGSVQLEFTFAGVGPVTTLCST